MDNDDDLVFLNRGEDEGYSAYQTQYDYSNEDEDPSDFDTQVETTIEITSRMTPYWQRMFG